VSKIWWKYNTND